METGSLRGSGIRARLIRNAAWLTGGSGAAAILGLGTTAVNSRALDLTSFGLLVLMQSGALFLAGLVSFSTQQPIVKLGVAAINAGDLRLFERVVGMGLIADAVSACLRLALSLSLVMFLPGALGLADSALIPALIVGVSLFFNGYRTAEGIFRVFDRFDLMSAIQSIVALLVFVAAIVLWQTDAPFVLYGWLVAAMVALPGLAQLIIALIIMRSHGLRPRWDSFRDENVPTREFVDYCWTTSTTAALDTFRAYGDSTAIGTLVSLEAVAVYNVAKQLAGVLRKLNQVYNAVVFPELASLAASKDEKKALKGIRSANIGAACLTVVVVLGAWIFGEYALRTIFGSEFESGVAVLMLLCASAGLQLISATYSMAAQAFVGPRSIMVSYVVACSVYLAWMAIFLQTWGLIAAGISQILFFAIIALVCRLQINRAFKDQF